MSEAAHVLPIACYCQKLLHSNNTIYGYSKQPALKPVLELQGA